jgi:phosphatidylethanolamine/phosphatidyl-N-methylethanolamine N-methyltransferase
MLKKDTIIRSYAAGAARYDELIYKGWRSRIDHQRVINALNPKAGEHFLEIGVGTGLNIPFYPDQVKFTGIDITEEMLNEAKRKLSNDVHSLMVMDGADLKFEDATFDGILVMFVVSACPDPVSLLEEAFRVTKAGGRLSVLDMSISPLKEVAETQQMLCDDATTTGFPPPGGEFQDGGIIFDPTRDILSMIKNTGWTVINKELFEIDNPFTCHVYVSAQKNYIKRRRDASL